MNKWTKQYTTIFFALVLLLTSNLLHGQDSSNYSKTHTLGEIVVSTNKLNSKLIDVSTKIELINSKKILSTNGNRLPEIIKNYSTIQLKSYGLTPQLQSISLNGLGAQHTLVLMDGVRLNSTQNSQVDLSIIPLENIERIEVLNNGVSSIYGSDAIGGLINIISKNRHLISSGKNYQANFSLSKGSFDTEEYSLNLTGQTSDFNLTVYYNNEISKGNFEYYFDNGTEKILKERQNSSYSLFDGGINTQYIIDNNNSIRYISSYSHQNKNIPGIETGSAPAKTIQKDNNWNNILISENSISNSMLLHSTFNFQNNFMEYKPLLLNNNTYKNISYSAASEIRLKKELYSLTTGYNFSHSTLTSNNIENGTKRNQHAIFLSTVFNIWNIKIFPSARYDHISDIDKQAFTYKFGINYKPFESTNFGIRANVGENFRAPSFNDLYWINSGNINLRPENSFNIETGLFYHFASFLNGKIDVSYIHINATDKIAWKPQSNGLWTPENIDESISKNLSFSISLSKKVSSSLNLALDAGTSFLDARKTKKSFINDAAYNKQFPYVPFLASNINLAIYYNSLELNLFYQHTGIRFSDSANKTSLSPVNTVDGNVTITKQIFGIESKLKFEINNLFNADYQIISGYPMPLRNFNLTLFVTI